MQQVEPVWLTRSAVEDDWRLVAACIAAQMASAPDEEARRLARLWTRVHPEGDV